MDKIQKSKLPHTVLFEDIHRALGIIKVQSGAEISDTVDKILRKDPDIKNALRRVRRV